MYKMLRIYGLLLFFSMSLIFSSIFVPSVKPVFADGIGIGIEGDIIPEMAQKALIIWDEDEGEEVLVLNASFGIDSLSNFSWIVPVQSDEDPDIRESDSEVFDFLEDIFPVYVKSEWDQYSSTYSYGGTDAGIEVIEIKQIGVYDLAIVWADDADTLVEWLEDEENGYDVPNKFENIVEDYIDKYDECYFVANKIDLNNEFSDTLDDLKDYSLGIYNDLMEEKIDLDEISEVIENLKYAIAQDIKDKKAYVKNSFIGYIMDKNDYNNLMDELEDGDITSSKLRDEIEELLIESELFETIYDLFEGAGTPIQITFYPDEPMYPLLISSLGTNFGGVDVYFAGPYLVSDENSILSRWAYADLTSSIESELEDYLNISIPTENVYLTHLVYRGYMDDIADDAIFVKYSQSSGQTPYPYYPSYPYPPIMNPYAYTMPYSTPMFSGFNFPSMFGGFSFNFPFGSGGLLGSIYGGIGGLYGTTFGGLYGSGLYGGFSGTFGGLYGSGLYGGFSGTFGGLYGSGLYGGFSGTYGGLYGSGFYGGFSGTFGGLYGSSLFPRYTKWPF